MRTLENRRVLGITPFSCPQSHLAAAVARAGARSVLDLGQDRERARRALRELRGLWSGPFGVRIGPACPLTPDELPAVVDLVVLAPDASWTPEGCEGRELLCEVISLAQARAAAAAGADALVVRGAESGGRVGTVSTFVLLQEVLAADLRSAAGCPLPVWAAGGIGPHTAAAAIAGGAYGVVLDTQLALTTEADLPAPVAAAVRRMDGTETEVIGGYRVLVRPDLTRPGAESIGARVGADLAALPVGEDAGPAAALADRHRTAAGVIAGVAAGIRDGITSAATQATAGHRPRVVQGPMTRVSDQAAFAAAVAAAGGLPFIALALMGAEDSRALLVETAELLGDRPWGVGILGFVPDDLRQAQLGAVHEVHPPYALIAGGRPAHAQPLEAAGITTFLHVPSPPLLERFVAEGARRFVFEGSECGGHVGPRASFPLWESQIQTLLTAGATHGATGEFDVLFAGGIHDARSAAMVAAAASPLVAAGGRAGVLMGTAYLFTREAVTAGAIGPSFQRAALACETTVLLNTAPGHATRCADTEFVATFNATRDRLIADGVPLDEVWAELEQLNIGRLRIASKGIRREGAALIPVDENTQARDGMVMIGDIARLRCSVTTVADLHREVLDGARELLIERAAELFPDGRAEPSASPMTPSTGGPLEVAIVGMAGVFPQAGELAEFWANVLSNHDAITEVPADRWDAATYFTGDGANLNGRSGSTSKWGGFLPDIGFDALAYGIPPAALASIEPVQLLSLEVAARALRDAGYLSGAHDGGRAFDRERAAVVFGAEPGTDLSAAYGFRALYPQLHGELPAELDAQLPQLTPDSFPGVLANVISGRIANRLDLGGANYTVDAACASALAALEVACLQLRSGAADLVLAGGADIHNGIQDYLLFDSVGALSPTGRCKPFDADADGIALGEGVACLVLKRLADAERDGDRIYAVLQGIGSASDGKSLGLTAPRPEGQRRALDRAYAQAGISPADVGLIEAHGTGTVVGDRTELGALTELFADAGAPVGACTLGSVKSQIGHTKCTAGLAGVIKAALAVHTGVLPPTGKITNPNPGWDPDTSPFVFGDVVRPWPVPRRAAGISAFGFGGTNFHTVLTNWTGAPTPRHGLDQWPAELFLFGSTAELEALQSLCAANDAAGRPWRLRDLARTTAERASGTVRIALVAADLEDLAGKLSGVLSEQPSDSIFLAEMEPEGTSPPLALLFPGQGSQRTGMLAELFTAFPRLQDLLVVGAEWAPKMFPPAAYDSPTAAAQSKALTDTRVAQPALGLAGLAMFRMLTDLGVRAAHLAGHSYGELVALTAAGALDADDLPALSAARGRAILAAAGEDPGTMAAVSASAVEVSTALHGTHSVDRPAHELAGVVIANHNGPAQTVISGPTAEVQAAVATLSAAGLRAQAIPVACAFHSPVVAGAVRILEAELAERRIGSPHLPVWSNSTATPYPLGPDQIRETLADQVAMPVRFSEQIEAMYAAGARVFLECGPGKVLSGLVGTVLGDRPHTAIATDCPGRHGVTSLLLALARLAVSGVAVDTAVLYAGRDATLVRSDDVPARPGWTVNGHLVRTADGIPVAGGLQPAIRVAPATATRGAQTDAREAVVLEFLRTSREMLATQREVVLGYLGVNTLPTEAVAAGPALTPGAQVTPEFAAAAAAAADPATRAEVVASAPAVIAPATGALEMPAAERIHDVLIELISERTGYPASMLDPNLDLEADLSIGSLKRTEIIGLLADRMRDAGLAGAPSEAVQAELTRIRTLQGIVDALSCEPATRAPDRPIRPPSPVAVLDPAVVQSALVELISERTGYPASMLDPSLDLEADLSIGSLKRTEIIGLLADRLVSAFGPAGQLEESAQAELSRLRTLAAIVDRIAEPQPEHPVLRRYLLEVVPAGELDEGADLTGRHVTLVSGTCAIALELSAALTDAGAAVRTVSTDPQEQLGDVDILVHLGAAGTSEAPELPDAFGTLRRAVLSGARQVLVVTGHGGRFGHEAVGGAGRSDGDPPAGLGLSGLVRTIAREYPEIACRCVDIDPKGLPEVLADQLFAEVRHPAGPELVGWSGTERVGLQLLRSPLPNRNPSAADLGLTERSVVLLTGGARGITATVAEGLAAATGCRLVLWGRSPLPGEVEEPSTAHAKDPTALRRALIEAGVAVPAEVERCVSRILAEREIRESLRALRAVAASVDYHQVDVRDAAAVTAAVNAIRSAHGRIDGVVHGAGVLDDRLIADKTTEGFARVWETKVGGARALAAALDPNLRFLVLFGSVSGVFGNRGQCDYSAANDALDTLARAWQGRFTGRVLSIDWGPWLPPTGTGDGMVTPELLREYARSGVSALRAADGVAALLTELADGKDPQVIQVAAEPEAFRAAFNRPTPPGRS